MLNVRVGSETLPSFRNEGCEIEAWHEHSWSEIRDYIYLLIYWCYLLLQFKIFITMTDHKFRLKGPFVTDITGINIIL